MKTFGQFSEDIEQRRQELLQKRLDQMQLQKRRVAEYQEKQRERVAAQVELQKQKTAERLAAQKEKEEQRKQRRKQEAEERRAEKKAIAKEIAPLLTKQKRKEKMEKDNSPTVTSDSDRP